MNTIILQLTGGKKDKEAYQKAAAFIHRGQPVAFPTETVYGLGGNGLDPASAARIYEAKGRPSDNPLILHIADREALPELVLDIPPGARALMDAFWPGPLTLIFQKSSRVPHETTGGLDTVAVRMPSHPAARNLIRAAGVPLAAPSANASGRPSPTCAEHVYQDLAGRIPLILDGGSAEIGLESTIVDVSAPLPQLLRPGYISLGALQTVVGAVAVDPAVYGPFEEGKVPRAPGMRYRHYAPNVPLTLVRGGDKQRADFILQRAREAAEKDESIGVLVSRETLPLYAPSASEQMLLFPLGERSRDEGIAHNLFGVLRHLEDYGLSHVYSETFEEGSLSEAIMNRLKKAAAFDILTVPEEGVRQSP